MRGTFRVEIARNAESDLEEIWTFIARDNPERATTLVFELEDQIHTLEHYPERCPAIPENDLLVTQYRQLIHGAYRVIFRISGKTVWVLRSLHGARLLDPSSLSNAPPR